MRISDAASQKILQYQSVQNQNLLSLGDIFTGRILSVKSGYLLMQLSDGSEIYAQVKSDDTYTVGDILNLKVIETQQNGPVLAQIEEHIVHDKVTTQTQINPENLLKSMDLPVTSTRVEILNTIIEMGENPSPELIENALNVMDNSNIDQPKHALFLVINEFEENEQYRSLLKEVDDGTFHFAEKLNDLVNFLEHSQDETLSLAAERFKSLTDNSLIKSSNVDVSNIEHSIDQLINELQSQFTSEVGRLFITADEFRTIMENTLIKSNKEDLPKVEQLINELQSQLASEDGSISLSSDKFKSILEDEVAKLTESGIPKVDQWIDELQKELASVSKCIDNSTDLAEQDTQNLQTTVRELHNAIQFFNDISSYEMFIQLPLKIKAKEANGELYIMKRKGKAGKANPKDFSIFLSLSTENIGLLDIFVNVKSKNVIVKVTAEDESFKTLFMNEYKMLHEALKDKGFNLFELSILPKYGKLDVFNAEQKANKLLNGQKIKIDIKV